MSVRIYELFPIISKQKSYYGKARVTERKYDDCVEYHLTSYNKPDIACVTEDNHGNCSFTLGEKWQFSRTTVRHVKDFLYQFTGVKFSTEDLRRARPNQLVVVKTGY